MLYADGLPFAEIQKKANVSRPTIYKCIDKALAAGVDACLKDYFHRPFAPVIAEAAKSFGCQSCLHQTEGSWTGG